MNEVHEKMMLIGLFLSKFDKKGLNLLGFNGFWEAYNTFALILGGLPKSINNYRDEFDPYFPNARSGWDSRPLRPSRKEMMEKYKDLSIEEFANLIRESVSPLGELENYESQGKVPAPEKSFAKRMMTGFAAENYFEMHCHEISLFEHASVVRTTHYGCGFDFKMEIGGMPFRAIEVKGLGGNDGSFQMTEKEYQVANILKDRYFLYIVRGFETPKISPILIRNPLSSNLNFVEREVRSCQSCWVANVTKQTSSNC